MERRGMPFIHLTQIEPGIGFRAFGGMVATWAIENPLDFALHVSGGRSGMDEQE